LAFVKHMVYRRPGSKISSFGQPLKPHSAQHLRLEAGALTVRLFVVYWRGAENGSTYHQNSAKGRTMCLDSLVKLKCIIARLCETKERLLKMSTTSSISFFKLA